MAKSSSVSSGGTGGRPPCTRQALTSSSAELAAGFDEEGGGADGDVADFEGEDLVGGGRRTVVAQTCSLLYRGFPIRWRVFTRRSFGLVGGLPTGSRRYSRLETCATLRGLARQVARIGARVLRTMGSVNERGV